MEEIKALENNRTWEWVPIPKGKKTVGYMWVFTIKYNSDGSIERLAWLQKDSHCSMG